MKIVVFGASGKTGALLTQQALDAGHEVVAYVRRADAMTFEHDRLRVVVGELSDRAAIQAAVKGAGACFSTLGGRSMTKHATAFTQGIKTIVEAMEAGQVKRFVYMSSIGAGESRYLMPQPVRFMIADVMLRIPLQDHTLNEERIAESKLDWTVIRPGGLTDGALKTDVSHGTEPFVYKGNPSISRASVAAFLLSQLTDTTYLNRALWLYE